MACNGLKHATLASSKLAPEAGGAGTALWRGQCELDVGRAARALSRGLLVAFPTETVYGLGADARLEPSVRAIFLAKGRPRDNPLIVHVASARALASFGFAGALPAPAQRLADAFWPGPLTLVLPLAAGSALAPSVTAGCDTVGVRVPRHPVAAALLAAAGAPVAAPSANRSGRPSPTCAAHVLADLVGHVAGVIDAGDEGAAPAVGLESTVVDATRADRIALLRPGAVSRAQLRAVARVPVVDAGKLERSQPPPAPGMKYRHYAPAAPLRVVPRARVPDEAAGEVAAAGGPVGVLADEALCKSLAGQPGVVAVPCGERGDPASAARALYGALRAFDGEGQAGTRPVRVILAAALEEADDGIAAAYMNRLRKAESGGEVLHGDG